MNFEPNEQLRRSYKQLYPEGVDLRPGSEAHELLKNEVLECAEESARWICAKYPTWQVNEEMLSVYIDQDAEEVKRAGEDPRKPTSIVVPEMLAILDTNMAYHMAVFSQPPLMRLKPMNPDKELGVILLELWVEQQQRARQGLLAVYTMCRDAEVYGFGPAQVRWDVETGDRIVAEPLSSFDPMLGYVSEGSVRRLEEGVTFEGSVLEPIDPWKYLPDPKVPIWDTKRADWAGFESDETLLGLMTEESDIGGTTFNVDYLEGGGMEMSVLSGTSPKNAEMATGLARQNSVGLKGLRKNVKVVNMYLRLIPREMKLGKGTRPEVWLVRLANKSTIISAHPMRLGHRDIPIVVAAPDAGGHEVIPVSKMETCYGPQKLINFYINTHIRSVMQNLVNLLLIDPKMANMADVRKRAELGYVRTRRAVWGRGVEGVMKQVPLTDVTQSHMVNLAQVRDILRNDSGAVDSLQGIQRTRGERVTAEEFRDTRTSAVSRMQLRTARIGLQAIRPMTRLFCLHTQYLASAETYLSTAGRWERKLAEEYGTTGVARVTPFDILADFDVDISDGSVDASNDVQEWKDILGMFLVSPEIAQLLDLPRLFLHIGRLMKVDDADKFIRNVQVVPNEDVPSATKGMTAVPAQ